MKNYSPKLKKGKGFVKASLAALEGHPKALIFQKALQKHKALNAWNKASAEFFEEAAQGTKAIDFKDGILQIACLSKELAYKIRMFAQRIIYLINQIIGKELVFALNVEY